MRYRASQLAAAVLLCAAGWAVGVGIVLSRRLDHPAYTHTWSPR